jgi:hypothetical protein
MLDADLRIVCKSVQLRRTDLTAWHVANAASSEQPGIFQTEQKLGVDIIAQKVVSVIEANREERLAIWAFLGVTDGRVGSVGRPRAQSRRNVPTIEDPACMLDC